jgi:hypothetical protein
MTIKIKKSILTVITIAVAVAILATVFFGSIYLLFTWQRSGGDLFEVLVLDPMPKSVEILHSQDETGFGGVIWLHFKISPDDFNLILASNKWKVNSDPLIGIDTASDSKVANWWFPKSFGDDLIKYQVNENHDRILEMWVNPQMDEVYYRVFFIH